LLLANLMNLRRIFKQTVKRKRTCTLKDKDQQRQDPECALIGDQVLGKIWA